MGRRRLTPARLPVIRIRKRHTKGRHLRRVREGRCAVPESLGLGPDRVVGLASFLIRNGACCMMRSTAEIASPQS